MGQNEKWLSGNKYLDLVEYFEWQKESLKIKKEKVVSINSTIAI